MDKKRQKDLNIEVKSFDDENFIIRGIFSTGEKDRQGEIVDQTGWHLDEYMKNPVVLFCHNYDQVIGKAVELSVVDGKLEGAIKFASDISELARETYMMFKEKFLNAFSVGFSNDRYEIDQANDTVILRENTLYEISAVSVPANAMALAKAKGMEVKAIEGFVAEKAVAVIATSNKETILAAIKTLTEVLKTATKADNEVSEKVEHPAGKASKAGGKNKVSVKVLNQAIRELLEVKKLN